MKNKFTANLGIKIMSFVIAVVLWLIVTTINDPSVKQTYYNIPVKITNTEAITDKGNVYEVVDGTDVISKVTITAPRSVLSEISDKNIIAVADVNKMGSTDSISIDVYTDKYNDQVTIKTSSDTLKLDVESKKTKTLALTTEITGKVEDGYLVGKVTTDQNLVRITGAESAVDSVAKAEVSIDVSGFTSDIGTNAEVKLYDEHDDLITDSRISTNIKTVGVKVAVLPTKEITILCEVPEEAAPGYCPTGIIDQSINSVTVSGKSEALGNINEIVIPVDDLAVSDKKGDYSISLDLENYLPDGVSLVNSDEKTVSLTVHIEAETVKYINLTDEDIRVTNVPEGYIATIALDGNDILELRGLSSELSAINKNNIIPTVDIASWMSKQGITSTELEEGFYNTTVSFTVPQRVKADDSITVVLHISKPVREQEE